MSSRRRRTTLFILAAIVILALLTHVGFGGSQMIGFSTLVTHLTHKPDLESGVGRIVWEIRLPRACACILVGGILGAVGSAFQAQLRNPLADPYIVGVSSGAAVGGALATVFGVSTALGGLGGVAAGFVSGVLSLALVYALAQRRGVLDTTSLLLAGVVVGTLLSALLSLILLLAGKDQAAVLSWLMGSTTPAYWHENAILLVALGLGAPALMAQTRRLNAFAISEDTARHLGVDTVRLSRRILWVGTAMTAAAVGAVGIIGFLGLVAPHIARRVIGVDWRWSLPASTLVGMLVLLLADTIAQRGAVLATGTVGMEVPVGIVTALLGAPSLLMLMRRSG